jgi:ABC-type nickel/cobalt efflux system permease component RcnA
VSPTLVVGVVVVAVATWNSHFRVAGEGSYHQRIDSGISALVIGVAVVRGLQLLCGDNGQPPRNT